MRRSNFYPLISKSHLFFPCMILALLVFATATQSCKEEAEKDTGNIVKDESGVPGERPLIAEDPLLELVPSESSGIDFVNAIEETFELNITTHINTSNGGGVAIADIDNDGLPDVYFISCTGENKLYHNKGDMKFEDITSKAGVASDKGCEMAVSVVDIKADGFLDFYVCRAGPTENEDRRNQLFINNGDLTFSEQGDRYGLDDQSASTGANFFVSGVFDRAPRVTRNNRFHTF